MKVDNTMLEAWDKCSLYYSLRHEQGWARRGISPALTFGQVLHLGLAEWYRTAHLGITHAERLRRAEDSIEEGWPHTMSELVPGQRIYLGQDGDDYRTLAKCLDTMRRYARQYPFEPFSVVQGATGPMVEIPFCVPLGAWLDCGEVLSVNTNGTPVDICGGKPDSEGYCNTCRQACEPIEYGGLIDTVINYSGQLYCMDHKSTSMLGSTFFTQFKPNAQMTGYTWGVEQLSGQPIAGCYINAIGVFAKGETRFERQATQRLPEEIAEWRRNVIIKCNAIARAKRTGEWDMRTISCVSKYGACEMKDVHDLPFESDRQRVLESDYEKRPWVFFEEHR